MLSKHTALSFSTSKSIAQVPFDIVHSDSWGPAQPHRPQKVDPYTMFYLLTTVLATRGYIYLNTNLIFTILISSLQIWLHQFFVKIKIIKSDSGGQYISSRFRNFSTSQGPLQQLS